LQSLPSVAVCRKVLVGTKDRTILVTRCSRICLRSRRINLSVALAEQLVGIREVDDQV